VRYGSLSLDVKFLETASISVQPFQLSASSPNLPQASSHFAGGGPSSSTLVGRIVTAQFDYSSTAVDDLNFTKGDRIQITEEVRIL
jgi:hypothetical protein